ncbi:MAG: hypothetical protein ACE5Q6_12925 [Dehalococcoidia bacterium]
MSAPETSQQNHPKGTGQINNIFEKEQVEMGAPFFKVQNNIKAVSQGISDLKEEWEMAINQNMKQTTKWIVKGLRTNTAPKVAIALGVLLIGGAALVSGGGDADGIAFSRDQSLNYGEQRQIERQAEAEALALALNQQQGANVTSSKLSAPVSVEEGAGESIVERMEVQRLLADTPSVNVSADIPFTERIEERMEVQRVLADTPSMNVSVTTPLTDSIEERLEVQRLLEELDNHNSRQGTAAYSVPTNSESIQERLEVQRVWAMMLEQ